jgi:RNA polymerase subunit RPABC4/transcription elongation factor Spt4
MANHPVETWFHLVNDTTTLECPECKEGQLTFKWNSEVYHHDGEYEVDSWIEMVGQTCKCKFILGEQEDLCEKAEAKMVEAYNVWAESQRTDDDMVTLDIEYHYESFPDNE